MPGNLIFLALHFAISKRESLLCNIMICHADARYSLLEYISCNVRLIVVTSLLTMAEDTCHSLNARKVLRSRSHASRDQDPPVLWLEPFTPHRGDSSRVSLSRPIQA